MLLVLLMKKKAAFLIEIGKSFDFLNCMIDSGIQDAAKFTWSNNRGAPNTVWKSWTGCYTMLLGLEKHQSLTWQGFAHIMFHFWSNLMTRKTSIRNISNFLMSGQNMSYSWTLSRKLAYLRFKVIQNVEHTPKAQNYSLEVEQLV